MQLYISVDEWLACLLDTLLWYRVSVVQFLFSGMIFIYNLLRKSILALVREKFSKALVKKNTAVTTSDRSMERSV